jgi:hypothetical protein
MEGRGGGEAQGVADPKKHRIFMHVRKLLRPVYYFAPEMRPQGSSWPPGVNYVLYVGR